jgi:hypothetical protein
MSNFLHFTLFPKTKAGIRFIEKHGPFYSLVKRFPQTFTQADKSFVVRVKSQRTGELLNINMEDDTDYKVLIEKAKLNE